jgi:hypothetical protein
MTLSPSEIEDIRTVSRLKFAADFAPEAFSGHLAEASGGLRVVHRTPSADDPMMARLLKVREREFMFLDTLNEHYELFYQAMWPSYLNWRSLNLEERRALEKIRKDALIRQIAGVLMVAGAVAAAAGDADVHPSVTTGMMIVGGQVLVDGFNVSKQADIHSAAIEELSESFGSEMEPVIMEFEGRQVQLKGSAGEQFRKLRRLLRRIYEAEAGSDGNGTSTMDAEDPEG